MRRRITTLLLAVLLVWSIPIHAFACNPEQSEYYVRQILFGDSGIPHSSNDQADLLMDALYLCSMQSDNNGQVRLNHLKNAHVSAVPSLSQINMSGSALSECAHNTWEYQYAAQKKAQSSRKKLLRNTVNHVFDFGLVDEIRGGGKKCESFAALLYYLHILADDLADDPEETAVVMRTRRVPAYAGKPAVIRNGGIPSFTEEQKKATKPDVYYSEQDRLGRAGPVLALIGPETRQSSASRDSNLPDPVGWHNTSYDGISSQDGVYNRSHLLAYSLGGNNEKKNLITGTDYLNKTGMLPYERDTINYIERTTNHVLYRVTPIYQGDNLIASGVQMEAWSVEDSGAFHFNVYCYNDQPGVDISYTSGTNELADTLNGAENTIPFALTHPTAENPDLLYVIMQHMEVLFADQKNTNTYTSMMRQMLDIATDSRRIVSGGGSPAHNYGELKKQQYALLALLTEDTPELLKNEPFYRSAFQ